MKKSSSLAGNGLFAIREIRQHALSVEKKDSAIVNNLLAGLILQYQVNGLGSALLTQIIEERVVVQSDYLRGWTQRAHYVCVRSPFLKFRR